MAGDTATVAAPPSIKSLTLDEFLDTRSAGFDLVRLMLAFLVLVSHTFPLGGFGTEPMSPLAPRALTLGGFAVGGFFALSGLLVGRSALEPALRSVRHGTFCPGDPGAVGSDPGQRVRRRSDRLAPPTPRLQRLLDPATRRSVRLRRPSHHLAGVVLPRHLRRLRDGHSFGVATGGGSFINGSLWTLPYEVRCYLVIGLVAVIARRFGGRRTITIAWLVSLALAIGYAKRVDLTSFLVSPYADRQLAAFLFVFLSGSLVAVWAHKITLFGWVPVAALALAVIAGRSSAFWAEHISQATMALVLPPLAALLASAARLLRGVDLSYGLYLYAWPMQQLVASFHWASRPTTFIAVSSVLAGSCAAISWFAIERPAMAMLRRR